MPKNGEIGRIGQNRYGIHGKSSMFMEEFLPELQGIDGIRVFTEMANNDATVGAELFAIENLMRHADFTVEPGGETEKDKEAAKFVESCMNDMEETWAEFLSECLSFITYGWSYHEICYKRRIGKTSTIHKSKYSDGLIGWRKLPIRAQDTLFGWEYKDGTDDLIGMTQYAPPDYVMATIPIEKALHFKTRSRKRNPEGTSILRTAYRAWYFKKRIEEIEGYGIERDLAGFPVMYSPPDLDIWDVEDEDTMAKLAWAERMVSGIRRDALEGLVIPGGYEEGHGWKLELLASSGKRQFDTNAIIDRYDKRIATAVLADFVMLGQQQVGSFALADSKTKIFALSIASYLDIICEVFNNQAIPRLIDMNEAHFKGITDYPRMKHGDIDEQDIAQFANAIATLVGAGALVPDEEMEKEIRRVLKLPEKMETAPPVGAQPGEDPNADPNAETPESKSVYKVTNIIRQYIKGESTRESAAELLRNIGLDETKINFHLSEADKVRAEQEKKKQEAERAKAQNATQNAPQKPAEAPQKGRVKKQTETPAEDEEDAQEAEKAREALGRTE